MLYEMRGTSGMRFFTFAFLLVVFGGVAIPAHSKLLLPICNPIVPALNLIKSPIWSCPS
jgi:hypothetical protein